MSTNTSDFLRNNLHYVIGVGLAVVVPGALATKLLIGGIAAIGFKVARDVMDDRIDDPEVAISTARDGLVICGLFLFAAPTIIHPCLSLLVKVGIWAAARKAIHDAFKSHYSREPFTRTSYTISIKDWNDKTVSFTI